MIDSALELEFLQAQRDAFGVLDGRIDLERLGGERGERSGHLVVVGQVYEDGAHVAVAVAEHLEQLAVLGAIEVLLGKLLCELVVDVLGTCDELQHLPLHAVLRREASSRGIELGCRRLRCGAADPCAAQLRLDRSLAHPDAIRDEVHVLLAGDRVLDALEVRGGLADGAGPAVHRREVGLGEGSIQHELDQREGPGRNLHERLRALRADEVGRIEPVRQDQNPDLERVGLVDGVRALGRACAGLV